LNKISLIIGSKSDKEVGDDVYNLIRSFDVKIDYQIISAHRDPERLDQYLSNQEADVYIAVAGLSAALPGYIASRTLKPVIGVPRNVKLGGLDALLSISQMPPGVPVACVGVDNGKNAAYLALRILGLLDNDITKKLRKK
jgi:5-(carboxyamino)imidazole ribonucleotide mutase